MTLHKQMCKKIAQLTKVVYRLNMMNQEHEKEIKSREQIIRDEMSYALSEAEDKIVHIRSALDEKEEIIADLSSLRENMRLEQAQETAEYERRLEERTSQLKQEHQLEMERMMEILKEKKDEVLRLKEKIGSIEQTSRDEKSSHRLQCKVLEDQLIKSQEDNEQEKKELLETGKKEIHALTDFHNQVKKNLEDELLRQLESLRTKMTTECREKMGEMQNNFDEKWNNSETEKEKLEGINRKLNGEIEELRSRQASMEEELRRNQELARECNIDMSELKKTAAEEKYNLQIEVREKEEEMSNMKKVLVKETDASIQLKKDIETLENNLESSKKQIASLALNISDGEKEREILRERLNGETKLKHRLVANHQTENGALRKYIDDVNHRMHGTIACLEEWKIDIMELKGSNAVLREECKNWIEQVDLDLKQTKQSIMKQVCIIVSTLNRQIKESQKMNSGNLSALKAQYFNALEKIELENDKHLSRKNEEHRAACDFLQSKIKALEKKLATESTKAREEVEQSHQNSLKIKSQWQATLEANRVEHKIELEHMINDCNSKWEEKLSSLQALYEESTQRLTTQIAMNKQNYEESTKILVKTKNDAMTEIRKKADEAAKANQKKWNSQQEAMEKEISNLDKRIRQLCHTEETLRIQILNLKQQESEALDREKDMKEKNQWLTSQTAIEKDEKQRLGLECSQLHSELQQMKVETANILKKKCFELDEIRRNNQVHCETLREQLNKNQEHAEKQWNISKANLEIQLGKLQERVGDLTQTECKLEEHIKRIKNELRETKHEHDEYITKVRNDTHGLFANMQKQQEDSKNVLKSFYVEKIQKLDQELQLTKTDLEKSKSVLQSTLSNRNPQDVEKIIFLENELLERKDFEAKLRHEMMIYKSELKNREDNFNARFTATNHNVGVLTTFRRPSTTVGTRNQTRFGKENRKNSALRLRRKSSILSLRPK